jgi:hypothetical protein
MHLKAECWDEISESDRDSIVEGLKDEAISGLTEIILYFE